MNTHTFLSPLLLALAITAVPACDDPEQCTGVAMHETDGDATGGDATDGDATNGSEGETGEDPSDPSDDLPANGTTSIDLDGDGVPEVTVTKDKDAGVTTTKQDLDENGVPELIVVDGGSVTITHHDYDQDGIPDVEVTEKDTNGDGKVDVVEVVVNIKGVPFRKKTLVDFDHDGKFDVSRLEMDTNGDGTLDYEEHHRDTDGDGVPDELFEPLGE